jgi:hypothetical protein
MKEYEEKLQRVSEELSNILFDPDQEHNQHYVVSWEAVSFCLEVVNMELSILRNIREANSLITVNFSQFNKEFELASEEIQRLTEKVNHKVQKRINEK